MSIIALQKLDAWSKSQDFAVRVHKEVLPRLPSEERFALASQIRRSAQSIPANIAEGHGRFYYQENIHFCYIARGSLEETLSYIVFANSVGYILQPLYQSLANDGEVLNRILNGYIGFLKNSKQGANEPGSNTRIRELTGDYEAAPLSQAESDEPAR